MKFYLSKIHDPYFNLATEEYFLKNFTEDFFMLYTNESTVVVGKHQNLLSEINSAFSRDHSIKIARRLSGGGTVYHDPGNINFSLIQTVEGGELINYQRFALPVLESLRLLGLNVQFSSRNDMLINDLKISGSAMHVYKNRVLAHGTILFDAEKDKLSGVLNSHSEKYTDKAIKSVRSKILNVKDYLPATNTEGLIKHLSSTICFENSKMETVKLEEEDKTIIYQLVEEKYLKFDWIYGYSPKYQFETTLQLSGQTVPVKLQVEKGKIKEVEIKSNLSNPPIGEKLVQLLIGKNHEIESLLTDQPLMNYINDLPGYSKEKFSADFF